MRYDYTHSSIRLTGRWDTSNPAYAETTATGSYLEFAFCGKMATLLFDLENNSEPLLHLWIEVDGYRVETPVDRYLRIYAPNDGTHLCRVIFKGSVEVESRWYRPLQNKVSFRGIDATPAPLPDDHRLTIEFVGDSITEGVLIDADYLGEDPSPYHHGQHCRVYQDDACATYAWLTAEALNLRPICMGYGAVGISRGGNGGVPAVKEAYPFHFDGSPLTRENPDIIVINHGANDSRVSDEEYVTAYAAFLDEVRAMNPQSRIVSLSAFCGNHHEALGEMIRDYNEKNGCNVLFIDSFGWIPKEPLHPLRDGHKMVAEHLIPILREWL